jgi:undecaprenyl diphosphate synthase
MSNAPSNIPKHVGFIMDGNRRWAKSRGKLPMSGHEEGEEALYRVLKQCFKQGVSFVSVYAFSTENWGRSDAEVLFLMNLVPKALKKYLAEFHEQGIKIVVLGSRAKLSPKVIEAIEQAETTTMNNTVGTLGVCFNYGGKQELVDATRAIVASGAAADTISYDTIMQYIYRPELPELDLIVRTSGEMRLSGFMLARSEYAEFIFEPKMWPDLGASDVDRFLEEFASRQRRIGK